MYRKREYKDSNYRAIFFNGKTVRLKIDESLPIGKLPTPEIEDIAINSKCFANCSYCYTSALKSGSNFTNIVEKAHDVWGSLKLEERPFQIAVGGAGESTIHPDWIPFMSTVKDLGIVPNYTTNGMHLSDEILKVTEEICGGVALSWHPHIPNVFDKAMDKLSNLNTHVIVGDKKSLSDLKEIYNKYSNVIDYFVILPYMPVGRAKEIETHETWNETFKWINSVDKTKFAFGALFYEWLLDNDTPLEMSIYEPELYSGYRLMDNRFNNLYKSSYDLTLK